MAGTSSWNRLKLGTAVLVATVVAGVTGYVMAGWRLLDAIYMVVITVFGVGYGEVRTIDSDGLRIFTMLLIIAGCSALIYILSGVFQLITEGELNRALGRRRMTKEISKLQGHVIICGFGRIGRVLAEELSASATPYVVADTDARRVEEAANLGALVFEGDATQETTLRAVGIERAHSLATVLPSDALNVFITLTARNLNEKLLIIARGEEPSVEPKLLQAGADRVVLPTAIGGDQIAQLILHPHVGDMFSDDVQTEATRALKGFGTRFIAATVPMNTPHPPSVGELERDAGGGFVVIAIRSSAGDVLHGPSHAHRLVPGDEVLVLTRSDKPPELDKALSSQNNRRPRQLSYRGARTH